MKTKLLLSFAFVVATFAAPTASGDEIPCSKIAKDVRDAVAKDPSKVLMVVEDALVINESCACEIVTSAIIASGADAALTKQIQETAVAVAPKMVAVIQDCVASSLSTGVVAATDESTESGKSPVSGKSVVSGKSGAKEADFSVQPPKDGLMDGGDDFNQGGRIDIRGVYLSQPAAGGFIITEDRSKKDHDDDKRSGKRTRIIRERRVVVVPISPTAPHPKS